MPDPVVILSWENHVDATASVLTASHAVSTMPIANIADPKMGRRWRTQTLTAYGQVDFGSDKTVGVVALRFSRDTTFPAAGTVQHQFDADGGTPGSGAAYDSTAVAINTAAGYGYHVHVLSSAVSARYWRFTFSSVTGVSFIDTSRAWAGEAWSPTYNIAFGYGDDWKDLSQKTEAERSGAEFVDPRNRKRQFAFALEALSESERDDIREMQRIAGISQQVLFVKNSDSPARETLLGRMARTTPILHPNLPLYSKAFTLQESIP